jgi:hypothetical protein
MDDILDNLAAQLAELQRYKVKYGPLSGNASNDEEDEGSDTEQE